MLHYRFTILALLALANTTLLQLPAQAQRLPQTPGPGGPTPAQVQAAIDRAVGFLLGAQRQDGGWPEFLNYERGVSCLACLALLNAGLAPDSPAVARALQYITAEEYKKTYVISLQTMAMCAANPSRYANQIRRNTESLLEIQSDNGGWGYDRALRGSTDPSNSQFALLALHEAQRSGVEVPKDLLKRCFDRAKDYWNKLQSQDGGFRYAGGNPETGSMTSAGVASLIIIGSQIDHLQASADGESVHCCGGGDNEHQYRVEGGLRWLGHHFSARNNPGSTGQTYLYYMYALERVGRMAGRRYLTDPRGRQIDWYREGVFALMQRQDETGSFGSSAMGNEISEASLGLLFLAKGNRQVVINWLEHGNNLDWTNHSNSVQHLTAHTEQAWKRDLAWQTVRLPGASVEDLLEAPVVFLSGSQAPSFTQEEKLLLKRYVEQGGFLFAEACNGNGCDGKEFEQYFQKLVVELFDAPLEKLPPEHPIWHAQTRVDPKDLPQGAWLYGVQTCCRLGVVYSPYSLSCRWELNLPYGNRPDYSDAVQGGLDTATKIGMNVLAYATGKELKDKLETVSILEEVEQKTSTERGLFQLPVLQHNAGSDDAPRAVKTLVEWLNQENPFQMSSEKRLISISEGELQRFPVVFMHGRGKLQLDERQRDALRKHFRSGGFVICNAICADEAFANSFRTEMELLLGQPLNPLKNEHPLFSPSYNGFDIRQLSIIDPARAESGEVIANTRKIAPVIEAGYLDGRMVVAFSPLDMSCALESRHSLQCKGYVREDAARLGINMVLFALQQ